MGSIKLDILFINPGNHKKTYQDLSKEYTAIATPAWTLLCAEFVRQKGFSTTIYDVNINGWDEKTAAEIFSRYEPHLVVIMVYGHNPSASTQTMPAARLIAKQIKDYNKDIPIAFGGIHASALPKQTIEEEKIDFVIQGEGPYTIEGLTEVLRGKKELAQVPGLWYREKGEIKSNAPTQIIKDLDQELPTYAWDLLPSLDKYRAHNMHCFQDFHLSKTADFSDIRSPYVAMNTSLGCPYNCSYCCINAIFGKPSIRYWSLDTVMKWFDLLVNKHYVRNIRLDDELFILSPERVERFCDMIIERKYDLNIWVYARVDTIKQGLVHKMKKAGINWVCLGIESGNNRVRDDVNKKIKQDIHGIVKILQDSGIYVFGNYMFGLPEDDLNTMQETLDLAIELNCEFANFYSVMAYPGSKLYDWASTQPGVITNDWNAFSQHSYETQPLPTKYLSPAQVLRFRDEAFDKYFNNNKYLEYLEKRFNPQVRKHIEKMLNVKIRRKLLETM